MNRVVHKLFWNWDKEEEWLNAMSANGLALANCSFCRYAFEKTPPGEYIYRLKMLDDDAASPAGRKDIQRIEEMGCELIAAHEKWVYFRKKAADGPFTLHPNYPSQINHNKKVRAQHSQLAAWELIVGLIIVIYAILFAKSPELRITIMVLGALPIILGGVFISLMIRTMYKINRLKREMMMQ